MFIFLRQGSNALDRSAATARSSPVMLSAAKHLAAARDRPFASLRVTLCDCSSCQGLFFTIEPCLNLIIGLESASTGHWPINRRCANKLCAYRVLPILVGKNHNRPPTMAGVFGSFLWRENICIPADYSATCSPLYVVLCSGWVLPVAQVRSYLQCLPPV